MDTDRDAKGRSMVADFGLVSLVVGGGASLALGIVSIGTAALLGRIPVFLGLLFVVAAMTTVFGLIVTIAAVRRK